ncbi:efflux RND transporter periplasmic adaptor subunit [Nonomuraea dietziae]|uniref:efflux RND transporter periplasmic adaptor subunit n=1 Tax=Nonomuraea dietziae TaxID=65515 RepID=UPI0033C3B1D9
MRPTYVRRGLLAVAAAALVGTGVLFALADEPAPQATVRLAAAQRGTVKAAVSAAGNTSDCSSRDLSFGAQGQVTALSVKAGDRVRKGQVLARIDSAAAMEAYTAAKADVAAAQDALEQAQATDCAPSDTSSGAAGSARAAGSPGTAGSSAAGGGSVARVAWAGFTPLPDPVARPGGSPPPTGFERPVPTVTVTVTEPAPSVTVTATATVTATVTATPSPSRSPSGRPTTEPTTGPGTEPGTEPGMEPGADPAASGRPDAWPSARPSPTSSRTAGPAASPTPAGTRATTPSGRPTGAASGKPTATTGGRPSAGPSGGTTPGARTDSRRGDRSETPCGMSEEQAESGLAKAQAAMEQAADAVRGTRIVAPASGTVLSVAGAKGDTAGTGAFITLGDLDELQVQALFTESDVNSLRLGQQAAITLATRQGERYSGTVTHLAPTATTTGRLVRYAVTITFDDPPKDLLLGQTATVTVTTGEADDALYVPAQAVKTGKDGTATVTVRTGSGQKEQRVTTGVRGDQYVQVKEGLTAGDRVVVGQVGSGGFPDGSWPEG